MYANFGTQLPGLTQIIVDLSEFVRNYAGYTALCLFGFLLLVPLSLHSRTIKLMLHKLPLKLPGIRVIYLKHLSARFSRTIGSLLTAGVEIVYAFNIATQVVGNLALGRRFEVATDAIISGSSLAKALEGMDIFPKTLLRLCGSGEKSGQLGNMLTKAADYFEKETENDLTLLTTLLEPIILLLLGALIAFLLIAMYLPMFELIGTL
jgi:type IV pilus assembly protein PilC